MNLKLFDRWDITHIEVKDPGLKNYIALSPILVPRSSGRNAKQQFYKNKYNIVERLMNHLMVPGHKGKKHFITSGHAGGKSHTVFNITEKTLKLVEEKTKKNPVEVLVKALENAAPREEITTIEYGGARYPQAVDAAPQRRVDFALRMMVQGAAHKAFGEKIKIEEALSEEIIKASLCMNTSNAVAKKLELERQADAAR
ncbi:30S ribosomal protein S7 [Candidatus Woesearchaeota archaeon]|nr:30S ribosomal protein S7 [Candidatus Woesearchaeota archaeon]MBI2025932.1 30S ribosomal protein S7 [Candidatus Levybacteria bacterium]